jgi:hypothetical protein
MFGKTSIVAVDVCFINGPKLYNRIIPFPNITSLVPGLVILYQYARLFNISRGILFETFFIMVGVPGYKWAY